MTNSVLPMVEQREFFLIIIVRHFDMQRLFSILFVVVISFRQ